jgi:hypothetical protein
MEEVPHIFCVLRLKKTGSQFALTQLKYLFQLSARITRKPFKAYTDIEFHADMKSTDNLEILFSPDRHTPRFVLIMREPNFTENNCAILSVRGMNRLKDYVFGYVVINGCPADSEKNFKI